MAKQRDSGLELLRIIAMLMVVAHHFAFHNAVDLFGLPFSAQRVLFEVLFRGVGKIGVICFFMISVWFLSEKQQSLRSSLRRVWIMERELLFWSVVAYAYVRFTAPGIIDKNFKWRILQPLTLNMWWYATFYAVFLALLPFVQIGLGSLGRSRHRELCIVSIVMVMIIEGCHAKDTLDLGNVTSFILLYAMLVYYRWYMKPLPKWVGLILIAVSMAVVTAFANVYGRVSPDDDRFVYQAFLMDNRKLPMIVAAFGLLIIFSQIHFRNGMINRIASAAFGVYLISDHPLIRELLWRKWFTLDKIYDQPCALALLESMVIVLLVFAVCIALDLLRQLLFRVTVDRHRGRWFDRLWPSACDLTEPA